MPNSLDVKTSPAAKKLYDRTICWLARFDREKCNYFAPEFPGAYLSEIETLCDFLNDSPELYEIKELHGNRGIAYFSEYIFKFHRMPFVIRFAYDVHSDILMVIGVWHGKWKRPKLVKRHPAVIN